MHTYRGTIPDNAEVGADLWWDPSDAAHIFVRDLKDTPANGPNSFKATFNALANNAACTAVFLANVSEFSGPDAPDVEENLQTSISLKITGAVTWSPA